MLTDFNALIIVKAARWVNLEIENVTVEKSDFLENSFVLKLKGMYEYDAAYEGHHGTYVDVPVWGHDAGSPWLDETNESE